MSPADVLTILLAAKAVDDRVTPDDAKAAAWHAILHPQMTLEVARNALIKHYADSTLAIMPAHLNASWRVYAREQAQKDEALRRELDTEQGVAMPAEIREKIAQLGKRWSA